MIDIENTVAAVSDPARRRILELVANDQLRTNDIAKLLVMSVPAVSRHLRVLRETGAVRRLDVEGDGRGRRYELTPGALETLQQWITDHFWTDTLEKLDVDSLSRTLLARVGGFLDGFAASDTSFFEKHLADDAYAIFPNSPTIWTTEAIIQGVANHPPYISWNVQQVTSRTLAPGTTLLSAKVDVQTTSSPTSVHQTMIFDDRSEPWKLRFLQQTTIKGTQP